MSFGADSELGNQTQVSRQTLTLYVKGIANETPCTCPITSNGRWKELHCGHSVTVLYALPLSEWIRTNFSESEEETSNANVELVICSLILCWTIEVVLLFVAEAHLQLALSKGVIHILHKLNSNKMTKNQISIWKSLFKIWQARRYQTIPSKSFLLVHYLRRL